MELVGARHEEPPVLAAFGGGDVLVDAFDDDVGVGDGPPRLPVRHQTLDAAVDVDEEVEQRFAVLLPVTGQLLGLGVLAAAQLQRDLETVGAHVVEVLPRTQPLA